MHDISRCAHSSTGSSSSADRPRPARLLRISLVTAAIALVPLTWLFAESPTQSPTVGSVIDAAPIRLAQLPAAALTQAPATQPPAREKNAIPAALAAEYQPQIQPLIKKYCFQCHAGDRIEADLDLESFATVNDLQRHPRAWLKVREILASGQMPPKNSPQPTEAEHRQMLSWVQRFLTLEAAARAGDPGPVVLRRLNNVEYTNTIRDITGVSTLSPAREFPVDSAAGEGFTNTGQALVISPALIAKYLDAAKDVASHAVLLPDGIGFSPATTQQDWTNERLAAIREFYRRYTDASGGAKVNLQGIVFDTNQGGRLPVEKYLAALLQEREALIGGRRTLEQVAKEHQLSPKYLGLLWTTLQQPVASKTTGTKAPSPNATGTEPGPVATSLLLDRLRERWKTARPDDVASLVQDIAPWQQSLWRFTTVGHIGKQNGPKAWMEPVTPILPRQEFRFKLAPPPNSHEMSVYLTAGDAGDGREQDYVVWERPRLVAPGRPELLIRDLRDLTSHLAARRERLFSQIAECLTAAAEANSGTIELETLARKHRVDPESLSAWLNYLGIGTSGPARIGTPIADKMMNGAGYDFISGWVGADALSVVANSSDQQVRIPGVMKPHSIAVHPAPTRSVAVGWHCQAAATVSVQGRIQHAHPECGNGVAWAIELRRGHTRQRLATGISQGATAVPFGPFEKLALRAGDVLALVINPKDGNHSCDLTAIDMTIRAGDREWDLARDLSPNLLAGNPHADGQGVANVWSFFSEPAAGTVDQVIPAGSILARWQSAPSAEEQSKLAKQLQQLLQTGVEALPPDAPDRALYRQLTSLGGPLIGSTIHPSAKTNPPATKPTSRATPASAYGQDPSLFGKHPNGSAIDPASLCVQANSVIEIRLPADLVNGMELVVTGALHAETGKEGSVQLQLTMVEPKAADGLKPAAVSETNAAGPWTSNLRGISYAAPIVVTEGSAAQKRFERAFDDFRQLFPAALCYTKIVPVDEVVTLTLFYREDDQLRRLMLSDEETAALNRLWSELHFIAQDALTLVDAYEQLWQYATQDADPKVFEPLRKPIYDRADAFRKLLQETEPKHRAAVLQFASKAYRRPLTAAEREQLTQLYDALRKDELPHDDAIRLSLARVLISPAFLYRLEQPGPGTQAIPVSGIELANRLSYFFWSAPPDAELRRSAEEGRLLNDAELLTQTRRLLRDPRARRLGTEFAAQWLHIYDFDQHDEKSERFFPTFSALRGAIYEEAILSLTDLIQNGGTVADLIAGDSTFLNEPLAAHYGIPNVKGPEWRKVTGVKKYHRGGVLTLAATLATQSGASRTSPILRGNWLSEVVMGEKLPKPPKNVPQLAETAPEGLTERQMIERHSIDPGCINCHAKIDPLGFALENFDAIGRYREQDAAGLPIDSNTKLLDGTELNGLDGLRQYLLQKRSDAVSRQFYRKLLGYALGRSVQLSDEPLIEELCQQPDGKPLKISAAIERIVLSPQFRQIRGRDTVEEE